jgi:3-deoxy-D-manno-octulosonic-acid transferase
LYLLRRILRDKAYLRHLPERFGSLRASWHRTAHGAIWLHAVSVGEILSAIPLVKELRCRYPNAPVYVSTATLAGRALGEEKLKDLAAGVFYVPIDYRFFVRRVFDALRPTLVIVMETEIWPNLYREAKRYGCSLVVVNGRISDKAFPTYRRWAWFFGAVLAQPDRILAQSRQDLDRYLALGAPAERAMEAGNLKFDFTPSGKQIAPPIRELLDALGSEARIWIAASTMPPAEPGDVDEDELVVRTFERLAERHRELLLILVPRKPERFDSAAARLAGAGIRFVRRSKIAEAPKDALALPAVLLLDSMGELGALFAVADVVFMGGTVARRGGHNLLEPAFFGKPVIVGPNNQNFAEIHAEFSAAAALDSIAGPEGLEAAVEKWLLDPEAAKELGGRARAVAESKRGVTARVAELLLESYFDAVPSIPQGLLATVLLWPFSKLWAAFARDDKGARSLGKPVISIGGITMGGTGKTPMAVWLTSKLRLNGLQPAILTRGYRRRTPHPTIVIPRGSAATTDLTGDEAQIYVKRRHAHLGIGADRFASGSEVLRRQDVDVFVLDDGFQHRKLARTVDIVLIDALDPFGGGDVFPLGRLREPVEQLRRGDIFVLTRVEPNQQTRGIEKQLQRWNPAAPVFRSRVLFKNWQGGHPEGRVVAFCGLANPRTFWRTLEGLGVYARRRWEFPDHHVYKPAETRRIAWQAKQSGYRFVVTTEKDYMNLSELALAEFEGLEVCWLEIDLEIENEHAFLAEIEKRIQP